MSTNPGDRLELLDAAKLALEGPGVLKRFAINNLNSPQCAQFVARQPHFAVAALADVTEQFVIGNRRWLSSGRLEGRSVGCAGFTRKRRRLWHRSFHPIANSGIKRGKGHGKTSPQRTRRRNRE
jgi:hypothetical protein